MADNEKKVIILNKPFLGGWLNDEGKIGHEVIDYFLSDNGNYYIYNNPRGACPNDIWVGNDDRNNYNLTRTSTENYIAKYMVLTSGAHSLRKKKKGDDNDDDNTNTVGSTFNILYVIELAAKIHRGKTGKDLGTSQKGIRKTIEKENIRYNGILLNEIYQSDETLYLTFEASKIYKANDVISFTTKRYNFQRNKGYIKSDDYAEDYQALIELIEKSKEDKKLVDWKVYRLDETPASNYHADKTFLDLIAFTDNEQAFTNMLHFLLSDNKVFKQFCKTFQSKGSEKFIEDDYKVKREMEVDNGRMDICGESANQKVIIENKIYSGLNGLGEDNHGVSISQLSTYYQWGCKVGNKELPNKPLCFITAPTYRVNEIEAEIEKYDPSMKDIFHIVTYNEIADFIEANKDLFTDNLVLSLFDQIVNAFRKWSYNSKEDLYADMFRKATSRSV